MLATGEVNISSKGNTDPRFNVQDNTIEFYADSPEFNEIELKYVDACENKKWTLLHWKKDEPGVIYKSVYR